MYGKKDLFHIWRKSTDPVTWFGKQTFSWPFCHILIHPFSSKLLGTWPQGACWVLISPERVLGRCHLFSHCSGLLALSIIMAEWEISLSPFYSPLDIGIREGKRQCSSHTVTFMLIAQGRSQRPFITQGRPLLRHRGFDSLLSSLITDYSIVTPRGTPPLNVAFLFLLSSFYATCISKILCLSWAARVSSLAGTPVWYTFMSPLNLAQYIWPLY